jgi:hypothetical protein
MAHKDSHNPGGGETSNVALFRKNDLPSAARSKNSKDITRGDLSSSQRSSASDKDYVVIIDGDSQTILAPTGNVGLTIGEVLDERQDQGI